MAGGSERRALVVGAGVGGLAAAIALRNAGWETVVIEREPDVPFPRRGELIWTNGGAALERLGAADAVRPKGEPLEHERFFSSDGRLLFEVPVGDLARRKGVSPPFVVRREDLQRALLDRLGDGVRTGRRVVEVLDDGSKVTAVLDDGEEEQGSVIVGADGADSTVRRRPGAPEEPESPLHWYYGVVAAEHQLLARGASNLSLGRGVRFGTRDLGDGYVAWYGVWNDGTAAAGEERKRAVEERAREFHPPIPDLVARTPAADIGAASPLVLPRLGRWAVGRVVLAGDAARAASPSYARGSGEALVDAVVLAEVLAPARDTVGALWEYESRRRAAADELRKQAGQLDRVASWRRGPGVMLRQLVMKRLVGPRTPARVERELAHEL